MRTVHYNTLTCCESLSDSFVEFFAAVRVSSDTDGTCVFCEKLGVTCLAGACRTDHDVDSLHCVMMSYCYIHNKLLMELGIVEEHGPLGLLGLLGLLVCDVGESTFSKSLLRHGEQIRVW